MTKFDLKNAPKGWIYPFSKMEIRGFIQELDVNFQKVTFKGTNKPSEFIKDTLWCWIGILSSERIDDEWHFSLEVSCLKEEYILPWKQEITSLVFSDIKKWVSKKQSLLATSPEKPRSLYLKYNVVNGNCSSSCFEVD